MSRLSLLSRSIYRATHRRAVRVIDLGTCQRTERGDTLIEILIAITILGLTGVALLGAFAANLTSAATYKNGSTLETVLKNFAEVATYDIQYQTPVPLFSPYCPTFTGSTNGPNGVTYNGSPIAFTPPPGFQVSANSANSIEFLAQNKQFSAACEPTSSTYYGQREPQLLTITATDPHGVTQSLDFVVASFQFETYVQPPA